MGICGFWLQGYTRIHVSNCARGELVCATLTKIQADRVLLFKKVIAEWLCKRGTSLCRVLATRIRRILLIMLK